MTKIAFSTLALVVLGFAVQANAADTRRCDGMGESKGNTVILTIVGKKEVKVDEDRATKDENYDPRLNRGFLRFEYVQSSEDRGEVLVQEKLVNGADKGVIKVQARGEGFNSSSFYCHP